MYKLVFSELQPPTVRREDAQKRGTKTEGGVFRAVLR